MALRINTRLGVSFQGKATANTYYITRFGRTYLVKRNHKASYRNTPKQQAVRQAFGEAMKALRNPKVKAELQIQATANGLSLKSYAVRYYLKSYNP